MTFQELFGAAKFVAASGECVAPVFRNTVTLHEKPSQAVITVCGLGFFGMEINGQPITADRFVPLNSHYHHYDDCYCYKNFGEELAFRIYACRYDVSALLKAGENELLRRKSRILVPSEMQDIIIRQDKLAEVGEDICVEIEEV